MPQNRQLCSLHCLRKPHFSLSLVQKTVGLLGLVMCLMPMTVQAAGVSISCNDKTSMDAIVQSNQARPIHLTCERGKGTSIHGFSNQAWISVNLYVRPLSNGQSLSAAQCRSEARSAAHRMTVNCYGQRSSFGRAIIKR